MVVQGPDRRRCLWCGQMFDVWDTLMIPDKGGHPEPWLRHTAYCKTCYRSHLPLYRLQNQPGIKPDNLAFDVTDNNLPYRPGDEDPWETEYCPEDDPRWD